MRQILKSERGSTSILVVIFMIVLMVFGLSILTTSLSNTRLAEKKRQWLTEYYALEGEVSKEMALIDQQIDRIKEETLDALNQTDQDLRTLYSEKLKTELSQKGYGVENGENEEVTVFFDVSEERKDIPKHIYVELMLPLPATNGDTKQFIQTPNFKVVAHTEWQEPFVLDENIKFEDPFKAPENP